MTKIVEPQLHIERIDGRPGERRLAVTYLLEVPPGDPAIGRAFDEEVVVSARDEHDAPILASPIEFRIDDQIEIEHSGTIGRRLEREVHRVDLDVEQDWWDTDEAGGTKPIAEFADHLMATIRLRLRGSVIAEVTTPVVTGSWGALGVD